MKWLNSFKIAIIEEDVQKVDSLLNDVPEFKRIDDMREAFALISCAKQKFENEQSIIQEKMNKIKKGKKFLSLERRVVKIDKVS